jgi:hypothetical protein
MADSKVDFIIANSQIVEIREILRRLYCAIQEDSTIFWGVTPYSLVQFR